VPPNVGLGTGGCSGTRWPTDLRFSGAAGSKILQTRSSLREGRKEKTQTTGRCRLAGGARTGHFFSAFITGMARGARPLPLNPVGSGGYAPLLGSHHGRRRGEIFRSPRRHGIIPTGDYGGGGLRRGRAWLSSRFPGNVISREFWAGTRLSFARRGAWASLLVVSSCSTRRCWEFYVGSCSTDWGTTGGRGERVGGGPCPGGPPGLFYGFAKDASPRDPCGAIEPFGRPNSGFR